MVIRLDENYNAMTSTALLGYVGETNARPVSVEGMEIDGADRYVLTIDYGDGVTYEVDITGGTWTPTADILRSAQTVSCQIAAKKLSGDEYVLVKKSRIFRLRIGAAIGDNAVPSPSVAADALDRIDAIGTQVAADRKAAETAAETATTMANNAAKSATAAEKSADTAEQAASRAETAKTAAETAAQTAQAVADSLPEDYMTAVAKIAENTAEIANVKLTDKELQRRVNALYDIGQGVTHKFETDSETAYVKTVPTGGKLMSVKSIGGHSEVIGGEIVSAGTEEIVEQGANLYYGTDMLKVGSDDYEYYLEGYWAKSIKLKPKTTYTIEFKSQKTSDATLLLHVKKKVNAGGFFDFRKTGDTATYTTSEDGYLYVGVTGVHSTSTDVINRLSECEIMISEGDTPTAYAPYHSNVYQIPEAIRNLPGYGIEGNVTDYEAKTYTQNNTVDGTEIKALDTPIVTDISTLIDDDFLRNIEVESGGSVTFKNSNDSYRIPVPSEEEYIVKLSEIGGTT